MDAPNYSIELHPLSAEEGGGYMAIVPELPGCVSDGQTDVEALANAHDAILAWIERARAMGREIPVPTVQRKYA
jgi:antitoxin HicB